MGPDWREAISTGQISLLKGSFPILSAINLAHAFIGQAISCVLWTTKILSTSDESIASVVDGTTNRLRMIVAEECVFDRHEACHAINLFDMNQKYADVLPLDEILKYLDAWRAEKAGQVGYANNSIEYLKDLAIGEEYKGLR